MKNKKLLLLFIPLIASGIAISLAKNQDFTQANAAFEEKKIIEDNFDGNEINPNYWTVKGGANLRRYYSSMRLDPKQYEWVGSVNLNRKLEGNYSVKMTLETHNLGGWLGVVFGNVYPNSPFTNAKGGIVFYDNDYSQRLDIPEDFLKPVDGYNMSLFTSEVDIKRDVLFEIKEITSEKSSLQVSIYQNNNLLGKLFDEPYVFDNSLNGYMSINSNLKNIEFYNVEVRNGEDEVIYSDDFSTSKVMYPSSGTADSEWYSTTFNEVELRIGYTNALAFNDVGDAVISVNPLANIDDKDLDNVYTINAEIQYSSMDFDVETGIEIGKTTTDAPGYFFGIRRLAIGYSLVAYDPAFSDETVIDYKQENADLTVGLVIEIYRDGTVLFKAGILECTVKVANYSGYYALVNNCHSNAVQHGVGGCVNYIKVIKNNHLLRNGKDIYMNFNGVKETYFEDVKEYAYDYYLSKREWNIGRNVSLSAWKLKDQGNGKLQFNQASQLSYFGPKTTFKNFVVRFDVEITSDEVPTNGCLGIQVGNSRSGLYFENAQSLGLIYRPDERGVMRTVAFTTNMDFTPGANTIFVDGEGNSVDIFKEHGKFTMMYVCENNVVSLYYLVEGEDDSQLAKIKTSAMVKDDASTDGLLAVYGANGISFNIDNLSIVNLDYEAPATGYSGQSAYQEVTRIDFANEDTIKGVSLNNANVSAGKLRINDNGTLTTEKLVNGGITRLNIKDIESTLLIKQDALTITLVNKQNKYIEVNNSGSTSRIDLDDDFEFRESLFEIKKLGTKLEMKYLSGDEPLSKIDQHIVSMDISATDVSTLVIESKDGFANLKGFTYINLNKYATIANRDYDPAIDGVSPWTPKEPINGKSEEKKQSYLGLIIGIPCGVVLAAGIAVAIIFIVRRRKKNEK